MTVMDQQTYYRTFIIEAHNSTDAITYIHLLVDRQPLDGFVLSRVTTLDCVRRRRTFIQWLTGHTYLWEVTVTYVLC